MPPSVQGLRGTARGLRSHGHPRHDPLDAPPPRAPKPKAPTGVLTFKTGTEIRKHRFDAPTLTVFQSSQVAGRFGHGNDPGFGMARILEDADVGARSFAGELNVLQIKELFPSAGPGRGLCRPVKDHEITLQAQPIAPVPLLTPADQIGGAVEAIPHEL